jgi:hypothetical protein
MLLAPLRSPSSTAHTDSRGEKKIKLEWLPCGAAELERERAEDVFVLPLLSPAHRLQERIKAPNNKKSHESTEDRQSKLSSLKPACLSLPRATTEKKKR